MEWITTPLVDVAKILATGVLVFAIALRLRPPGRLAIVREDVEPRLRLHDRHRVDHGVGDPLTVHISRSGAVTLASSSCSPGPSTHSGGVTTGGAPRSTTTRPC
jgi:hypothetical protein